MVRHYTGPARFAPSGGAMSEAPKQPKDPQRHSTYVPKEKKSTKAFHPTPMLDQLESGPWPSRSTIMLFACARRLSPVTKLGQGPDSSWSSMGVG